MKRQIRMEEISDGRLYGSRDMVKAGCNGCAGCSACCRDMGDSILLDPLDVHRIVQATEKSAEQLLQDELELGVADGILLPHLRMTEKKQCCPFLNEQGRCSIHAFRPGLCRLFPLGRKYEEHSFRYFLQIHECRQEPKTKVQVRKWIDTPDVPRYEQFITDWHYFLKPLQEYTQEAEGKLVKTLNMYLLRQFYLTPYQEAEDFYDQFAARLEEAGRVLQIGE